MTTRRDLFRIAGSAALMLAAGSAFAQATPAPTVGAALPGAAVSSSGIVVVEVANLYCDRCRQVNDHFPRLQKAAEAAGLELRFAPVSWEGQSVWPDRVYYAARDLYPATAHLIRDMLFDGIQREGMAFENLPQVLAHFERKQLPQRALEFDPNFNLAQVADRAATDDVLYSEMKAGRLVQLSTASEVPVFVWLRDGNVIKALSPRDARDPLALVQLVLRELANPTN